jgi:hypothetical protein
MNAWAAIAQGALEIGKDWYGNRINKREAKRNRGFQERMARNAYQYAVQDMKAAGLNPMLAFSQGGASTPSGSTAKAATGSSSSAISNALQAKIVSEQVKNLQADTQLKNDQAATAKSVGLFNDAQTQNTVQQTRINKAEADFWAAPTGSTAKDASKYLPMMKDVMRLFKK